MQTNWLIVADEAVAHVYEWQGGPSRCRRYKRSPIRRRMPRRPTCVMMRMDGSARDARPGMYAV